MACEAGWENLCLDNIDGEWWGVAVELIAFVYSFVTVAIVADRHLVVSLETLCVRWNVREDVAGASFMALGSAAPEVIINAISTLKTVLLTEKHDGYVDEGHDGDDAVLGVGAILGSGMIAFTAIPGICGVAAGGAEPLLLKRRPLARDLVTYLLSISWLCYIFSDGRIEAVEAAVMLAGYVCYMLVVVYAADVRRLYRVHWLGKEDRLSESFVYSSRESSRAPSALATADSCGERTPLPTHPAIGSPYHLHLHVAESPFAPTASSCYSGSYSGSYSPPAHAPAPSPPSSFLPVAGGGAAGSPAPEGERWTPPRGEESLPAEGGPQGGLARAAGKAASKAATLCILPVEWLVSATCPPCEHDGPTPLWYPVTLATSFTWVAILSLVISAIVSRFGAMLDVPAAFLGMYVIAIGAEIPDTIQSVTVAKRGYGSMAVSNSCGSQIVNVLVGLGLPWLLSCSSGLDILLGAHRDLLLMALFQAANLAVFASLLILSTAHTWRPGDHRKSQLTKAKGKVLICTYVVCISSYPIVQRWWSPHDPPNHLGFLS